MTARGKEILLETEGMTDEQLQTFQQNEDKQADLAEQYEEQEKRFAIIKAKAFLEENGYVVKTIEEFDGMLNRLANI